MRVLLVCNRLPDALGRGDAKLAHHAASALEAAGHAVDVRSSGGGIHLLDGAARRAAMLLHGDSLQLAATFSARFEHQVRAAVSSYRPDVIVGVHARAVQYVPEECRSRSFAFLYDSYFINYGTYASSLGLPASAVYAVERRRIGRFEDRVVSTFGRTGFVSQSDADFVRSRSPRPEAVVHVPYAVDLAHFSAKSSPPTVRPCTVVFSGRLNYLPNQDAARYLLRRIWPAVRQSAPEARLVIAGADPPAWLVRMARRPGVHLARDVPDIRGYLSGATAMFVPMRMGGGVQTKVLEAMASRVPVVCSSHANAGLQATPDEHLLIATSPQEYAQKLSLLIRRPALGEAIRNRAQRWVEEHHSPRAFAGVLVAECEHLAARTDDD